MKNNFNSLTFLEKFNKDGGEGIFTKIVKDTNSSFLGYDLNEDEEALIYYNPKDNNNAILITNQRIIEKNFWLLLSELSDINIMIRAEYENGVTSKDNFTLLSLEQQHRQHVIKLEEGLPFWGIFQSLYYVVTINKSKKG